MRVDEVIRTFPGRAKRLTGRERTTIDGLVAAAAIRRVSIGSHPYGVSFLFDHAGMLSAVQLRLLGSGGEAKLAFDELFAELSAEHGPALEHTEETSSSGSWARAARWSAPAGVVDLHGGETVLQESRIITVNLREGVMRAMPEGNVVLTYRARGRPWSLIPEPVPSTTSDDLGIPE